MAPAGTVVGIRYHNLIAAAKLGKPAISVSYSAKHDVLMDDLGLGELLRARPLAGRRPADGPVPGAGRALRPS